MSMLTSTYSAFIESVCNQFNCREALPALKEGFKAFCEARRKPPEYMVLYRGFNGKHAHEGTIYNMLGCRNNALWASPYIEYAIEYASQFGKDGHIAKITLYDSKMNLADMDDLEEVGYEPADAIDIGTDPDAVGHLLEMGKNTVSNYLHDSEDGYCIMDLDIVADIHVMTPEELATAGAEQSELEYLGCDGWFKQATKNASR
jgi:hypothetical protein